MRDGGSGAGQKGEEKEEKVKHCHFDLLTLELKQKNGDVELGEKRVKIRPARSCRDVTA